MKRYLKLPRFNVRRTCQSGPTDRMSVKGGTRTAVSAKLITSENANGTRKKTKRYRSGGTMISHSACRLIRSPYALRSEADALCPSRTALIFMRRRAAE